VEEEAAADEVIEGVRSCQNERYTSQVPSMQ